MSGMEEQDYAELFGVELPSEEPAAETTDGAAQQAAEETNAAEEPAAEEPDTGSQDGGQEDGTDDDGDGGDQAGEPAAEPAQAKQQTKEERARFAAQRRQQEQAAAIAKARQEATDAANAEMDKNIEAMGLQNPYTKQPIKNREDFAAYRTALAEDQRRKMMKKAGLTEESYKELVEQLPEVQQARQEAQQAKAVAAAAQQEQAQRQVDGQLAEITKLNPEIKSLDDLVKMDTYQELYDRVKRGYSLVDAYRLANMEALTAKQVSAAKQQARNNTASKGHMRATQTRGKGAATVPTDVAAEYRELMPGISDAEIAAHWNKYQGN